MRRPATCCASEVPSKSAVFVAVLVVPGQKINPGIVGNPIRVQAQPVRRIPVIGIQKRQPVACRGAGSRIAGRRDTCIGLPDQRYPCAEPAGHVRRPVAGTIVDDDDFMRGPGLCGYRIDRPLQCRRCVVGRDDDGKSRLHNARSSSHSGNARPVRRVMRWKRGISGRRASQARRRAPNAVSSSAVFSRLVDRAISSGVVKRKSGYRSRLRSHGRAQHGEALVQLLQKIEPMHLHQAGTALAGALRQSIQEALGRMPEGGFAINVAHQITLSGVGKFARQDLPIDTGKLAGCIAAGGAPSGRHDDFNAGLLPGALDVTGPDKGGRHRDHRRRAEQPAKARRLLLHCLGHPHQVERTRG